MALLVMSKFTDSNMTLIKTYNVVKITKFKNSFE